MMASVLASSMLRCAGAASALRPAITGVAGAAAASALRPAIAGVAAAPSRALAPAASRALAPCATSSGPRLAGAAMRFARPFARSSSCVLLPPPEVPPAAAAAVLLLLGAGAAGLGRGVAGADSRGALCDAGVAEREQVIVIGKAGADERVSFGGLKWLKLAVLVVRLASLKDVEDPLHLFLNVAILVLALATENPQPSTVAAFLRARSQSPRREDDGVMSGLLKDLRDVATQVATSVATEVEVTSFGVFSIAVVRSGMDRREIVLLGALGDWWVLQEDCATRRYAPGLLLDDFIDSCTEIMDSIRESHLFEWFRERL